MSLSAILKGLVKPFLFVLWLFLAASTALASDIPLSFEAGLSASALNKDEYAGATGGWMTAAAHFRHLSLEAGYQDLGRFDLENVSNTHIDVSGYAAGVSRRLHLNDWISLTPQLGIYAWKAEATFLDQRVGDDRGSTFWAGVTAHFGLTRMFELLLRSQWFADVSEANVNTLSLGLTLNL